MSHPVFRAALAFAVLIGGAAVARRGASATAPSVVGVRQLDVGYRLGEGGLKIRATLVTGEAIEYSTTDPREAQTILEVTQACASGALSAVVDGSALRAIQCSIDRRFGVAR